MRPKRKDILSAIPDTMVEFSSADLRTLTAQSRLYSLTCLTLDRLYRCVDLATWQKILAWSRVDKFEYKANFSDCDNFAAMLHGQIPLKFGINTCGYVLDYSGSHAYNAIVYYTGNRPKGETPTLKIGVIEPQTDGFVVEPGQNYVAKRGNVIWA